MTPDLQNEFRLLSDRARNQLKDIAASGSYRRVYSLWTMPSFAPCSCCTIYSPRPFAKGNLPFAQYNIWRSDLDLEKFRSPVERLKHPKELTPTFQHDVLKLTESDVEQIERRIRGISIPPYLGPCTVGGVDGTGFEFVSNEGLFAVSLRWWENHPVEWRPFTETILKIATELEVRLREKTRFESATNADQLRS